MRSESIVPYTETQDVPSSETEVTTTTATDVSDTSETVSTGDGTETTPKWHANGAADTAPQFEYDLSFSPNLLVVDYGVNTVNVYQANYSNSIAEWEYEWIAWEYSTLVEWSTGRQLQASDGTFERYLPDCETSKNNIQNVQLITLNEIEGYEDIASKMNLPADSQILRWTYTIKDFPTQCYSDFRVYDMPENIQEMQYAQISAKYIDGLPTYGEGSLALNPTYEWTDVIEPSHIAIGAREEGTRYVNKTKEIVFEPRYTHYIVGETIESDLPVVDPRTCEDEIKRALEYEPIVWGFNDEIHHIWENNIEIYCMELTYVALDPKPNLVDDPEREFMNHDLYLVPAWEVYFTITNPEETGVYSGKVLINAVTGKSLYSDEYGDEENVDLYPGLSELC